MQPIFITGTGTGIGKTLIAAIVTEALQADYWKPVQAGFDNGTDTLWVKSRLSNEKSIVHNEVYKLIKPASPHIAAQEEHIHISSDIITAAFCHIPQKNKHIVIEGAGGLFVPLNENEFVIDLIKKMHAKVILVSRNYLGSINHSLLTAEACKAHNIDVAGWIFNDQYLNYENEIVQWTGFPRLGSIPFTDDPGKSFVSEQAVILRSALQNAI